MKKNIHPEFYENATITCSGCGRQIKVGATVENMNIGVCSECHPFYTGTQRIVDEAGRVDRFNKKYSKFINK